MLIILFIGATYYCQSKVRVMSYNLHNYPNTRSEGTDIGLIETYYKKVVESINPDILLAVEILTQDGVNRFREKVLGTEYNAADVVIKGNGLGGNDLALFYKDSLFNFIRTIQLPTYTRDICEFSLAHRFANDTLIIYAVHLKANTSSGDNNANIERRAAEIDTLRKRTWRLKTNSNYVAAGDFNILDSYEPAFTKLLDSSAPGYFYDPQQAFGVWNNNELFAYTHSYSPTKLNTRFDMILLSQAVIDEGGVDYTVNSFKVFGNDGNHFDKSVLEGNNYWFEENNYDLGLALTKASDHLPVFADLDFGVQTSHIRGYYSPSEIFRLEQNFPNPFNLTTVIFYRLPIAGKVTLKVYDLLGKEVAGLVDGMKPAGNYAVSFTGTGLASGVYLCQLKSGSLVETKKIVLLK